MARKRAQTSPPDWDTEGALDMAASRLDGGDPPSARQALLPVLDHRGAEGDRACALAAALLRLPLSEPPLLDQPLPLAMDRLLALVRQQQAQIQELQEMVEGLL